MNTRQLDEVPLRCQRLLIRLRNYNYIAEHCPGKEMYVSDALSRKPLHIVEESNLQDDIKAYVESVQESIPNDQLLEILSETQKDSVLQRVMVYVNNGWPKYEGSISPDVRDYYAVRSHLSTADGLLIYHNRIVVPFAMRKNILEKIHSGHFGMRKSRQRASETVWWPCISQDLKTMISECDKCQIKRPSQPREPMMITPMPDLPWQKAGTDIFEFDKQHYMVLIDYHSRYLEILHLPDMTSKTIIARLLSCFARHGVPQLLVSDNGPQYVSSEFKTFSAKYEIRHVTSSPYFPQANGEAERAVRTAKEILACEDPPMALLAYRTTPTNPTGLSPSQLCMNRLLRTNVPVLPNNLRFAQPDIEKVKSRDYQLKLENQRQYNKSHSVRPLVPLAPNDTVRLKTDKEPNWTTKAVVLDKPQYRSYRILTEEGQTLVRNRAHIMKVPQSSTRNDQNGQLHGKSYFDPGSQDKTIRVPSDYRAENPVQIDTPTSPAQIGKTGIHPESLNNPPIPPPIPPSSPSIAPERPVMTRSGRVVVVVPPKRYE